VLGLGIFETVLLALVCDETGKPNWLPIGLFEFERTTLPTDWEFALLDGAAASGGDACVAGAQRGCAGRGADRRRHPRSRTGALRHRPPTAASRPARPWRPAFRAERRRCGRALAVRLGSAGTVALDGNRTRVCGRASWVGCPNRTKQSVWSSANHPFRTRCLIKRRRAASMQQCPHNSSVTLTSAGARRLDHAADVVAEIERIAIDGLNPPELQQTRRTLEAILANFDRRTSEGRAHHAMTASSYR